MEMNVTIPKATMTDKEVENITKIFQAKGKLIAAAFDTDDIKLNTTDDSIIFAWKNKHSDDSPTYIEFLSNLCTMAKDMARVNLKVKDVTNEKYTFRAFLLRLGYGGNEKKNARKVLMQYLNGDSALRTARESSKKNS